MNAHPNTASSGSFGPSRALYEAIHDALRETEKTRDPMNALVVWCEMGRGLAGKLALQGASPGLLRKLCAEHLGDRDSQSPERPFDPCRAGYVVPKEMRLSGQDIATSMKRIQRKMADAIGPSAADTEDGDAVRALFLKVVRGWFWVGLDIARALSPTGTIEEARATLRAWCLRHLPQDTEGPADLGVRREKASSEHATMSPRAAGGGASC